MPAYISWGLSYNATLVVSVLRSEFPRVDIAVEVSFFIMCFQIPTAR